MALLELRQLEKRFGGVHAVRGCSFSAEQGAITALVGPNGAGKTTVFNMISGMIAPDAGEVFFQGTNLTTAPAWKRARAGIARTFQHSRLFQNLSLEENLALALREDDHKLWRQLLRGSVTDTAEREQIEETLVFVGLEKDLSTPITELSYGEQKLFDLARALLHSHTLLMLDEPVAGVNPVLRDTLSSLLLRLKKKGETILLIEHDMAFIRGVADHVIVLDQGSVLAQGVPSSVLSDARVLDAYLGTTL